MNLQTLEWLQMDWVAKFKNGYNKMIIDICEMPSDRGLEGSAAHW